MNIEKKTHKEHNRMALNSFVWIFGLYLGFIHIEVSQAADPVWGLASTTFSLNENSNENTPIVVLTATDADSDPLTYSIQSVNPSAFTSYFKLIGTGGDEFVVGTGTPDAETVQGQSITVTVGVSDGSTTVSETLTITITDLDDVAPVITVNPTTISILEGVAGIDVAQITTSDGDFTNFGAVTVAITGGDTAGKFEIVNGVVKTKDNTIAYGTVSLYNLVLTATDPNSNTGTTTLDVTIETAPKCTHASWTFNIGEDSTTGSVAIAYGSLGTDEDSLPNTPVTFAYVSGPPEFEMNSNNLVVTNVASFDFESGSNTFPDIVVSVSDGKHTTTCSSATVSITNVNEAPVVTSASTVSVADGTSSGIIYTLSATDPESDAVTFTIIGGNEAGHFSLTGADISVASALDRSVTASYSFTIQASDTLLTTPFTLTINVNGAPVITSSSPSVDENLPIGTDVHTIVVTDPDSDTVTLNILTQDASNPFQLVGNVLKTAAVFDHETTATYDVTIKATDDSTHPMTSMVTFTIAVGDVNEAPVFSPDTYTFRVLEQGTAPEVVATLTVTDPDAADTLTFSINGDPPLFVSNADALPNLEIRTTGLLIFDVQSSYSLTVKADDAAGLSNTASVNLQITTKPTFSLPSTSLSVPESSAVGYVITPTNPADKDGGTMTFSVDDGTFEFVNSNLVLKLPLDYETTTSYTPTITVTDNESNTNTELLQITVTDSNDLSPVFQSAPYSASVLEKNPTGETALTVAATDGDTSLNDNNVIAYSIEAGNDAGKFAMDRSTGVLTATNLVYSEATQHVLTVIAVDRDGVAGGNTATAMATITVQTAPAFTTPTISGEQHSVPETSTTGSIYTLVASDADNSLPLVYNIESISPAGCPFQMDTTNNAQINLVSDPDLDVATPPPLSCDAIGKVTDSDGYTATTTVNLVIAPENDNPPVFAAATQSEDIDESLAIGSSVAELTATDADTDSSHNAITFSITAGNDDGKFAISSSPTNQVEVSAALNDQTAAVYTLTITASDGVASDTATLTVNVAVSPVFTAPSSGGQTVSLNEDAAAGDTVFTAAATDLNTGDTLTYAIESQPNTGQFAISSDKVVVGAGQTFDHETSSTPLQLTLSVTDAAGHKVVSPTLTVNIADINDVNPSFASATYTVNVKDASPVGKSVIQLAATDLDSTSPNNQIATYAITGGDTNGDFTISNSGLLTVAKVLDRTTTASYTLTVTATDSGSSALQGATSVAITVIQDTDPVISGPASGAPVSLTIPENTAIGNVVYSVTASDADGDTLLYTIKSQTPAGTFEFVGSTGDLKVATALNYEAATSHTLDFYVDDDDGDTSNKQTSGLLTITVTDVNDFPRFQQTRYNATATGGITEEQLITQVVATDDETSQTLRYLIVDGDPRDAFTVNNTGHIFTKNFGLNPVQRSHYVLAVQAIDNGSPSRRDSTHVYIDVTPIGAALNLSYSTIVMLINIGVWLLLV